MKFNDNDLFCKRCLTSDSLFSGGGSWGIDICPTCGGYECISYKNMSWSQKIKLRLL